METVTAGITGDGVKHLVRVTIDTDGEQGTETAEVTARDGHPFWVPELGEWIDATDLQPGQWLQTGAGTWVQITAIQRWTTPQATVHNLTIANTHTYYVVASTTPVLVHNCGDGAEERLKAIADETRSTVPKRQLPGTVSESIGVLPSGLLVIVHTTSGSPGPLPGRLMSALTACGHAHGGCSEVSGIAKLMQLGATPESVTTVGIHSKRIGAALHGQVMAPCLSCAGLLSALDITPRKPRKS